MAVFSVSVNDACLSTRSGAPLQAMMRSPVVLAKTCVIIGGLPPSGYSCAIVNSGRRSTLVFFLYVSCSAVSMGSKGTGSLAHMATSITRRASGVDQASGASVAPLACTKSCASDMRFSVMVPVLSVQITVAEPSVSTVVERFTMTPCLAKRHAPSATNVAKATGISSGRMDMASVSPVSKLSNNEPLRM